MNARKTFICIGGRIEMRKLTKAWIILLIIIMSACQSPTNLTDVSEGPVDPPESITEPRELTTVTIHNSTQINYAPIFFAEEYGYFEEYGIQLEVLTFNRVTEAVPLLVSGQLDVYAGSISAGLLNIFGQEPYVKAVADRGKVIQDSCTFQAILARKDLYDSGMANGPADLEGMSIVATSSATRGFHLAGYLAEANLSFEDVTLVDMPTASLFDAFENKAIDFIVIPETTLTRLLKHGNAVIISRAEDVIGPYQSSILAFGPRLLRDDPDLGVRFMAAYLKGVIKYNEGKTPENIQILVERTGEDLEVIQDSCWVPIREDGFIYFGEVDPFQQWSVNMDQLDMAITEEQFWTPRFLEAAQILINEGK
jgi:NitT/TauT family transport system substrate-binding protein